jgi:hypothetical protein
MKRALLLFVFIAAACSSTHPGQTSTSAVPGHAAISLTVAPNPIVATKVSGTTYDFPFDVIIRETGGHPVTITRVSADVSALGGIRVANETYDAARIRQMGYSTSVPANGELRYHFAPRRDVTDDRLFTGVSAALRVDAVDDTGTNASATTTVTVTHQVERRVSAHPMMSAGGPPAATHPCGGLEHAAGRLAS